MMKQQVKNAIIECGLSALGFFLLNAGQRLTQIVIDEQNAKVMPKPLFQVDTHQKIYPGGGGGGGVNIIPTPYEPYVKYSGDTAKAMTVADTESCQPVEEKNECISETTQRKVRKNI